MFYNLLYPLSESVDWLSFFNIFRYITFRSVAAVITSLILCFFIAPPLIKWLKKKQKNGQPIREDCLANHALLKKGTPTMGGMMILISIIISTLLWADLTNKYVWIVLGVTIFYGFIGFIDDFLKITKNSAKGLHGKRKFFLQSLIAFFAAIIISKYALPNHQTHVAVPFFKELLINMGWFYFIFAVFVIVGTSNAVNLTDGLDGLVIVPIMIAVGCFALISYLVANIDFTEHLKIIHVKGVEEIVIICAAMLGAGLGFLWFNAPPAQVFMGDTGSLSLGGMLGTIAVIVKHEIVLAIVGGLFVIETASVIIQVYYFKLTGKRIFLMSPIHHHFEKKGWSEPTIVIRFWIIAFIFALIGLATLKLR